MARAADRNVNRIRNAILAGVGLLVVAVIGVGLFYSLQPPPEELTEGTHYLPIEGTEGRPLEGPVVVTEFFSYGCVHCRNFDPQIEDWKQDLPEGVSFRRVPVAFSGAWRALAQAYYAAEELGILERNHERLFDAIHTSRLNLNTDNAIAAFFDGNGTDEETFRREMNSPAVRRAADAAEALTRELQIRAVPTIVVDGRYQISNAQLSRQQVLDVADRLITQQLAARDES